MNNQGTTSTSQANVPSLTHKVVSVTSLILAIVFNAYFVLGSHPTLDNRHSFHVRNTAFTANGFFILVFWLILYVWQLAFTFTFYSPRSEIAEQSKDIGWHFTLFNILQVLWAWLFGTEHYIWSEIVIIINFINLLSLYVSHRPYALRPFSTWALVHIPTTAMPISWASYAIFWNGAVAFHATGLAARIVANILIWDLLLVPALFMVLFRDYAIGFATSYIMFGLGVGQLFTKVIALQWIFAFTIAGILFVGAVAVALTPRPATAVDVEEAPRSDERAPLLAEQ